MSLHFPKKYQWLQFFKVLNLKEKIIFFFLLFVFVSSGSFLFIDFYLKNTKIVPTKGGEYIEGIIGFPSRINPVYAPFSEIDMALSELIFSGLLKYGKDGKLEPDLAESWRVLEDGKVYEFYLKDNLFWQDGQPLTVDDIIFTIETIKNPEIASPLRPSWLGVEIEKISDKAVKFKLRESSNVFLENCTLKIIPKHIWEKVPPATFKLSSTFTPVGSGPYKIERFSQDKEGRIISLDLIENYNYYGKKPYIPKISFRFFEKTEDLILAFNSQEIKGFALKNPEILKNLSAPFNLYRLQIPRYFAIFFNLKSEIFPDKTIRTALNYGTNKEEIINEVIFGQGRKIDFPLFSEIYQLKNPEISYDFNPEKAKELLREAGFKDEENGKRIKIVEKEPFFQLKNDLTLGSRGEEVKELQKCLARDPEIYPQGEITGHFGQKTKEAVIKFQEKYKKDILEPIGLEKPTGEVKERTRQKLNEICFPKIKEKIPLKFALVTGEEEILKKTVEILKRQWEKLGVLVEIKTFDLATLEREILRKRSFDALFFGILLRFSPDPFSFWHSSQRGELGLNLSNYNNREVDSLLEEARKTQNENEKREKLEKFQEILLKDSPAIFLYSPYYLYAVSKDIQGLPQNYSWILDPSKRFSQIENWYIKTKRIWQ